jgi:acyl carrier protein
VAGRSIDSSRLGWLERPLGAGHVNGSLLSMSAVPREQLRVLMGEVLAAQGKSLPDEDDARLSEIGFRSLDFSELALRVEDEIEDELNFDAAGLRQINTVADVLDLLLEIQEQ